MKVAPERRSRVLRVVVRRRSPVEGRRSLSLGVAGGGPLGEFGGGPFDELGGGPFDELGGRVCMLGGGVCKLGGGVCKLRGQLSYPNAGPPFDVAPLGAPVCTRAHVGHVHSSSL